MGGEGGAGRGRVRMIAARRAAGEPPARRPAMPVVDGDGQVGAAGGRRCRSITGVGGGWRCRGAWVRTTTGCRDQEQQRHSDVTSHRSTWVKALDGQRKRVLASNVLRPRKVPVRRSLLI